MYYVINTSHKIKSEENFISLRRERIQKILGPILINTKNSEKRYFLLVTEQYHWNLLSLIENS